MALSVAPRGECADLRAARERRAGRQVFGLARRPSAALAIGATVAVGLFEGRKGVNAWLFAKCCFGWVITLVVVGTTTALLVGPSPEPLKGEYCDNYCQVNSREWMQ